MSLTNPNHAVTAQRLKEFHQGILPYLNGPKKPIVYGIRILANESVPSSKIEYLEDAADMTPAYMDYTNDVFDYGSWENAFFMPKPCMLKYDGTVDYYLDPNDYSKKVDGTASDISDTSYAGNAMMEWGQNGKKIWLKVVPDSTKSNNEADVFIASEKIDDDYKDWSFHNSTGESVDHFYTPIYNGSLISGKLRSMSGQAVMSGKTAQQEMDYAAANNPSGSLIWTAEVVSDIQLINFLFMLMFKTTNSQVALGEGLTTSGTSALLNDFRTGVHNTKGLFYGTNSGDASVYTNAVKVFGMENWWGFQCRRYLGEILVNRSRRMKYTYNTEDGSNTVGYNVKATNYIIDSTASVVSGTNTPVFISKVVFNSNGMFPVGVNSPKATATTYFPDSMWYNGSATCPACRGGGSTSTTGCGIFTTIFNQKASDYYWYTGAAPSAKPLS